MSKSENIIILKVTPELYFETIEFAYAKTFLFFEWWVRDKVVREYSLRWNYAGEVIFITGEHYHSKAGLWNKVCQETFKKVLANFKEKH